MEVLQVWVQSPGGEEYQFPLAGLLVVGRQQDESEPGPYHLVASATPPRLVIAPFHETQNYSRWHVVLDPQADAVRVTNRGRIPLRLEDGSIGVGATVLLKPPFTLHVVAHKLTVSTTRPSATASRPDAENLSVSSFEQPTLAPGTILLPKGLERSLPGLDPIQLHQVILWLKTTVGVLQSALGSEDFLGQAARALVEIVGLDFAAVILQEKGRWTPRAAWPGPVKGTWTPSQSVLGEVALHKTTVWVRQEPRSQPTESLMGVRVAIASPLLDESGQVRGLLYGERRSQLTENWAEKGQVEAVLVDLLACGVAAGLTRQEQQLFKPFFGMQLVPQLRSDPTLLQARQALVSCLFCDVCGYSGISEDRDPEEVFEWMNDVLGTLSERVLENQGVLVDYIGDGLLAMWGAPKSQPDQECWAVRTALAIRETLTELNGRWEERLKTQMDVGTGIHTGPALVGNVGSRLKFKYGPMGSTVNIASRVQGLTKYLSIPLLVTAATRQGLGDEFVARRVVQARLVGLDTPLDIYQVEKADRPDREELAAFFRRSEEALEALEAEDYRNAVRRVGELLPDHPDDTPLLLILARATQALTQGGSFEKAWRPPGK